MLRGAQAAVRRGRRMRWRGGAVKSNAYPRAKRDTSSYSTTNASTRRHRRTPRRHSEPTPRELRPNRIGRPLPDRRARAGTYVSPGQAWVYRQAERRQIRALRGTVLTESCHHWPGIIDKRNRKRLPRDRGSMCPRRRIARQSGTNVQRNPRRPEAADDLFALRAVRNTENPT